MPKEYLHKAIVGPKNSIPYPGISYLEVDEKKSGLNLHRLPKPQPKPKPPKISSQKSIPISTSIPNLQPSPDRATPVGPNTQQSARAKSVDTHGSLGLNLATNQNSKETHQNDIVRLDQLNEYLSQRNIQKLKKLQGKESTPATGPTQNLPIRNSQVAPKKDLAAYSEWFHNLKEEEYDMRELSKKSSIIKYFPFFFFWE